MPLFLVFLLLCSAAPAGAAQVSGVVRVEVRAGGAPVADAEVVVNGVAFRTGADGLVDAPVSAGAVDITVVRDGFAPITTSVTVAAGQTQAVVVELE
ncbi:MAG: PEGA domain-containing protein, partial [Gammaproteobacteria bacterium]